MSTHTNQTNREDAISINKKTKKVKPIRAKKKQLQTPLVQCETDIVTSLSQQAFLYMAISKAQEHVDLKHFCDYLQQETARKKLMIDRLKSIQQFLRVNLDMDETDKTTKGFVYQSVNEKELGCRLMQDVQAGILVNPVYVYSPADAGSQGIPPLSTIQKTGVKKDLLSVESAQGKLQMTDRTHRSTPGGSANVKNITASQQSLAVVKPADLTYSQKAVNFLFQFLNQVILLDDKITAKQILKNDSLFGFLQQMHV